MHTRAKPRLVSELVTDFPRPLGAAGRLSPEQGDAALVGQLRTELADAGATIASLSRLVEQLKAMPHLIGSVRIVKVFRAPAQSLVEVVGIASVLEAEGYKVVVKWSRDAANIIDGVVVAVSVQAPSEAA
jgi:hypothetical protein